MRGIPTREICECMSFIKAKKSEVLVVKRYRKIFRGRLPQFLQTRGFNCCCSHWFPLAVELGAGLCIFLLEKYCKLDVCFCRSYAGQATPLCLGAQGYAVCAFKILALALGVFTFRPYLRHLKSNVDLDCGHSV